MSFVRNYTTERLAIDVLPEMQNAVRDAAAQRNLSAAAYLRRAISSALTLDGFSVPTATSDEPYTVRALRRADRGEHLPTYASITGEREYAPKADVHPLARTEYQKRGHG